MRLPLSILHRLTNKSCTVNFHYYHRFSSLLSLLSPIWVFHIMTKSPNNCICYARVLFIATTISNFFYFNPMRFEYQSIILKSCFAWTPCLQTETSCIYHMIYNLEDWLITRTCTILHNICVPVHVLVFTTYTQNPAAPDFLLSLLPLSRFWTL